MSVRRIPPGRIASYGEVAACAGSPGAARAVGNIMRDCHRPDVPCHRVVAAGGRLGGYGGDESLKRALLLAEGVKVVGKRIRDFKAISAFQDERRASKKAGTSRAARTAARTVTRKGRVKRKNPSRS
jgi:O-6-methylguanine DNA methyltransferase